MLDGGGDVPFQQLHPHGIVGCCRQYIMFVGGGMKAVNVFSNGVHRKRRGVWCPPNLGRDLADNNCRCREPTFIHQIVHSLC
jgi:hypothetical protein